MCNFFCYNSTVVRLMTELSEPAPRRIRDLFFMLHIGGHRRPHAIFLIAALIIFPKYTDLICIFNQCSNRIHLQPTHQSCHPAFPFDLPRDPFPWDEFAAQGPFRRNSIFAISSDYRRNREVERSHPLLSYRWSIFRLSAAFSRLTNIVQPLLLNSISFVSFHVFCYAPSTCVWNKVVVKWIRNWRTIREKSEHCQQKFNFSRRKNSLSSLLKIISKASVL